MFGRDEMFVKVFDRWQMKDQRYGQDSRRKTSKETQLKGYRHELFGFMIFVFNG